MNIKIIDTRVSLPIELVNSSIFLGDTPLEVVEAAKQEKIWHMLAWDDTASNKFGFYHKRNALCLDRSEISNVEICFMKPAKGRGWVALEVIIKGKAGIHPIFEATVFDEKAIQWFLEHKSLLDTLFGQPIKVSDCGSDY